MPFKLHADYRRHISKQKHRVTNRAAHEAGLRQSGSLTVWFTDAAIAAWRAEPRRTPGGQPRYSALAITTALTLRSVFGLALRQTEGLIGSIIALLHLDLAVPDHTILSRRARSLDIPALRSGDRPLHLLVDSTGLRLCGPAEWLVEKHGSQLRRAWRKRPGADSHLLVSTLQAAVIASSKKHEAGRDNQALRLTCPNSPIHAVSASLALIGVGRLSPGDDRAEMNRSSAGSRLSRLRTFAAATLAACTIHSNHAAAADALSDPTNWPGPGRTAGEQHYSPLAGINDVNVSKLGLAWSLDLGLGNSVTAPVEVDGVLYIATGYSIVRAIDAVSGRVLWIYDPKAPEAAGLKLRQGWGIRGLAYDNRKIFVGTQDGRLIAIEAKSGQPLWSVLTVPKDDMRFISGAPRVFDGKVIIGHGGADVASIRGYVTTYDQATGKQLWRFYTVPKNPADGFESKAMEMAAKTWSGDWWKYGGGGTVWNAMTYDKGTATIIIGVGNGSPWNHKIRSEGKGDNLFICAIVGLDAKTGAYKWHYQINPGESWDYNAAMDMELADLKIDGVARQVLITAPKNGFLYVIDRNNGKLISAKPFVTVSWATRIDLKTGRPIENPDARFPDGKTFTMWPGPVGAHTWLPMAFSPKTNLVYIPAIEMATKYNDRGITRANWKRAPGGAVDGGEAPDFIVKDAGPKNATSSLLAWDPVAQKAVWSVPTPGPWNGGVMATAGDLVFQGRIDGTFNAYAGENGKRLWSFAAQAPVTAPPITYSVGGKQYVTVLTGMGTSGGAFGPLLPVSIDYRTQARRVLTFAIGGTEVLPKAEPFVMKASEDPSYRVDSVSAQRGSGVFAQHCATCHGVNVIAAGNAPDLRASLVPINAQAFAAVVHSGALVSRGMPRFEEFPETTLADLRQYIRAEAARLRTLDTHPKPS